VIALVVVAVEVKLEWMCLLYCCVGKMDRVVEDRSPEFMLLLGLGLGWLL
jgi:hypothetical protein